MKYIKTSKLKLLYTICLQSSLFNQQEALTQKELGVKLLKIENDMEKAKMQGKNGVWTMMGIYNHELNKSKAGVPLSEKDINRLEDWLEVKPKPEITSTVAVYTHQAPTPTEINVWKKSTPEMMEYLKRFNWLELKNKMMAERPYQSLEEQWKSLKAYTNILKQQCFDLLELCYECKVKSNYFAYDTVMTREGAEKVKQDKQLPLTYANPDEKQQADDKEDEAFRVCVEDHNREDFISKQDTKNMNIEEQSGDQRRELETFPEKIKQLKNQATYNRTYGRSHGEGLLANKNFAYGGLLGGIVGYTANHFSYNKADASANVTDDTSTKL